MRRLLLCTLAGVGSLSAATCWAQSFNIDLDTFHSTRETGGGAPQPSFGGAAGQPGYWNMTPFTGPWQLRNLHGQPTGVWFDATNSGSSGGGWRNPRLDLGIVNDDFWLLMGDAADINPPFAPHQIMPPDPLIIYTFDGLQVGVYDVFTYGVIPAQPPRTAPVYVSVPGAMTQNPQVCTGPMPPDWQFRAGVTHTRHRVVVATGRLQIHVTTDRNRWALINGFQIAKVK